MTSKLVFFSSTALAITVSKAWNLAIYVVDLLRGNNYERLLPFLAEQGIHVYGADQRYALIALLQACLHI